MCVGFWAHTKGQFSCGSDWRTGYGRWYILLRWRHIIASCFGQAMLLHVANVACGKPNSQLYALLIWRHSYHQRSIHFGYSHILNSAANINKREYI